MPEPAPSGPTARLRAVVGGAVGFAAAVVLVYALSLRGGFLNYDDDWLVRDNPVLRAPGALTAIWTDLRPDTRQALGAEFLPVRDTLVWLELRAFGPHAPPMRAVSLLFYLGAALLLRAYLRGTLGAVGALAAWLFALHPVHAESVAWLAGQKDLVALLLVAAALWLYAGDRHRWLVPPLLLAAMFGKAVAVAAPLLLPLHDLLVRRRPRWRIVGASLAVSLFALVVHVHVGRAAGMIASWPGGSRAAAFATMGPVWWRYLGESLVPLGLSVHHDVPARSASDLLAWLAYLGLLLLLVGAFVAVRRRERLWPFALGWFVVPLLPTSQVLAPLQNLMADRYLLLAVLGPCLALAALAVRAPRPVPLGLALVFAALTFSRAHVFSDSVALFTDATAKSPSWPTGWYQLGLAQREVRDPDAVASLRRAIALDPQAETARRAGNNLCALLVDAGALPDAQAVARDNVAHFPDDPRALNNLAEITARLGQRDEALHLFEQLIARFPDYQPGRRNYQRLVTSPAPAHSPPAPAPPPAR